MSEWMSWDYAGDGDAVSAAAKYKQDVEAEFRRKNWFAHKNKLLAGISAIVDGEHPPQQVEGRLWYNRARNMFLAWNGETWCEVVPPENTAQGAPPFAGYETWVDPNTYIRYIKIAPGKIVPLAEELVVGHGTMIMGNDSKQWSPETKLEPSAPAGTAPSSLQSQVSSLCKTYEFSSPPLDFSKK